MLPIVVESIWEDEDPEVEAVLGKGLGSFRNVVSGRACTKSGIMR